MLVLLNTFDGPTDGTVDVCYSIGSHLERNITRIASSGGMLRIPNTNHIRKRSSN